MAKKKKMKKIPIVPILVAIIIVLVAALVGPKVVHECADCGETIIGAGYEPNKLAEFMADGEEDLIICETCAEEQHAIALATGKTLDDFKRDLF